MNVGQQVPEYKEPSLYTIGFHSQIILRNSSPLQKMQYFIMSNLLQMASLKKIPLPL